MATKVKFKAWENDFVLDHYTKPVQIFLYLLIF